MSSDFEFSNKIFDAARIDLDLALRDTVAEMFYNQKMECSVGLRIKIKVKNTRADEIVPEISYSVSTNVPVKSKIDGKIHGDVTLNFDGSEVTLETKSEQISMLEGEKP